MGSRCISPTLTDHELADVLTLTNGADSVELELRVQLRDWSRAGAALGVDPLDGQIRQVYFLDTPDLVLNESGLVARADESGGKANSPRAHRRRSELGSTTMVGRVRSRSQVPNSFAAKATRKN